MSTPARILMVTGDTSPSAPSAGQILFYAKDDGVFYSKNSSNVEVPLAGGTVASVNASGGTTGLTFSGGPITSSGTLTLGGILGIANGGTGATTQSGAIAALLPSQTGNAGRYLTTDGTNVSWGVISGTGTVTSVGATGTNGVTISGSPITTSGSFTIGLGNITPTSISATGAISTTGSLSASNFSGSSSGTNTGDQTITLTGDVTGSGTGSFVTALSATGVSAGTYGSASQVPVFTVDSRGRISSVTNTAISVSPNAAGTVTGAVQIRSAGGTLTASDSFYYSGNTLYLAGPTDVGELSSAGQLRIINTTTGQDISLNAGADLNLFANAVGGNVRLYTNATARLTINDAGAVGFNSQFGSSGQVLTSQGNGSPPTWATLSNGTVTSVAASGGTTGLTFTGSPITTTGTLTLGGTLAITNGGTGATTAPAARTALGATTVGSNIFTATNPGAVTFLRANADNTISFLDASTFRTAIGAGAGTVTSVAASGGTTGLTFTGSPITSSGTLTLSGTLAIANGGTGATTQAGAANAILPSQTGNAGRFLTTNGTNVSWEVVSGTGTVTSVAATGNNGITISGSPITTSGTLTLGLGAITPTSVAASGTVTGSNLSGTNTGDQTITLTGDVTGSGTGSFAATLSNTGVSAGTYGSATQVPVFTVDAKGRISSVTNTAITGGGSSAPEIVVWNYSAGGSGNFTPVDALFSQTSGVTATVTDGANSIATYTFTGKSNPPKSITAYGQVYSTNTFVIRDITSFSTANVVGGGTSAAPDIRTSFTSSNVVTLQTTMANVGASAGLGQRAWLVLVFGF